MNIVLIGYRGTGKSTLGRLLAQQLGLGFVDTDVMVTERSGRTIKQIFEDRGEAGFRELEMMAVKEAAGLAQHVIAVGGGAILRPENVAALKASGKIIWLQAEPEMLHARIDADAATSENRPHLAGGGIGEIKTLLTARTPLYRAAADAAVNVSNLSFEAAVLKLQGIINPLINGRA